MRPWVVRGCSTIQATEVLRRAYPAVAPKTTALSASTQQDDLSNAVAEAISDYVQLRGLNGLCPDVRQWGSPPGPAAFLDAGLPKIEGSGSLPRGLTLYPRSLSQEKLWKSDSGRGSTRGRNNSVSPTWEAARPDGSLTEVLSFGDGSYTGGGSAVGERTIGPPELGSTRTCGDYGTADGRKDTETSNISIGKRGGKTSLGQSWSTPELAGQATTLPDGMSNELPLVDAKQVRSAFGSFSLCEDALILGRLFPAAGYLSA